MKNMYRHLFTLLFLSVALTGWGQNCVADAGEDVLICGFDCVELSASEGETYQWWPNMFISDTTSQNVLICLDTTMTYYVTVTDSTGCSATDTVTIFFTTAPYVDAGPAFTINNNNPTATLQGDVTPGAGFFWTVSQGGNIVQGENTLTPTVDAAGVYTLTAVIGECNEEDITVVTQDESIEIYCWPDTTVLCHDIPFPDTPDIVNYCQSAVLIQFNEDIIDGDCPHSYTIIRHWTATNGCNKDAECTQTIHVIDTLPPEFVQPPADLVIECDAVGQDSNWYEFQGVIFDNCSHSDSINIDFFEIHEPGVCDDHYVIHRTWVAIDECGNSSEYVQTITVEDTTSPEFDYVPADAFYSCDGVPTLDENDHATAFDNCDQNVEIVYNETTIPGDCPSDLTIIRNWVATDNCGNSTTAEQIIEIRDTMPPVFAGQPQPIEIDCSSNDEIPEPQVTDNCNLFEIDFVDVFVEDPNAGPCEDVRIREWIATDACGNSSTVTQQITFTNSTSPTPPTPPADTLVQCAQDVPQAENLLAEHPCNGQVQGEIEEQITPLGNCDNAFELTRIWHFTDACGNQSSVSQTITVLDTTAPVPLGDPQDMMVDCFENVPPFDSLLAEDNCDGLIVSIMSEAVQPIDDCETILDRTWSFIDHCGNESSVHQRITVKDTIPPEFVNLPAEIHHDCYDTPTDVSLNDYPLVEDNCEGQISVDYIDFIAKDTLCEKIIHREWLAWDNCGNQTVFIQTIYKRDTLGPVFTFIPQDTTMECGEQFAPFEFAHAEDNCTDVVNVDFIDHVLTGDDCFKTIEREWIAIDDCGNISVAYQIIHLIDSTPPEFTFFPQDMTEECGGDGVAPMFPQAVDNCAEEVFIGFSDVVEEDSIDCQRTIIRTWVADDNCGNIITRDQIITEVDTQQPVFVLAPQDKTIECHKPIPSASEAMLAIVVEDNCDNDVEIFFEEFVDGFYPCDQVITRHWFATDNCGNTTTHIQQIFIHDPTPPVFEPIDTVMQVACGSVPPPITPEVADNCTDSLSVNYSQTTDQPDPNSCEATITRKWTVFDDCQNMAMVTQTIYVIPECGDIFLTGDFSVETDTLPVLVCIPAFNGPNTIVKINGNPQPFTPGCDPSTPSIGLMLDAGLSEIIIINEHDCEDTIWVDVIFDPCADVQPISLTALTDCGEEADICLDIPIHALEECIVVLNDEPYQEGFGICPGTFDILQITLEPGNYELLFINPETNCVKFKFLIIIETDNVDCDMLEIPIEQGWNMISSYVMPKHPAMEDVFEEIADQLVLVKGDNGVFIPNFNINQIGDWEVVRGYKVKARENTILLIKGTQVDPATTPIPMEQGWQMIAYLRDSPSDVFGEIAGVSTEFIIIKDGRGGVAIPRFGINTIGDFIPGRGYKVKAKSTFPFFYSPNTPFSGETEVDERNEELNYFTNSVNNTGSNSTVLFPLEAVSGVLNVGDEVGVFNSSDILCGAAVFNGNHFAVTIWGDDITTEMEKEGFENGESYLIKHWNNQTNIVSDLDITWTEGNAVFTEDAISIAGTVIIETTTVENIGNSIDVISTPNPAKGSTIINIELPEDMKVQLQLTDITGRILQTAFDGQLSKGQHQMELSLESIPAGVYLYELLTPQGRIAKRLVVR